jgi:uncharacterized protein YyaL (SSP411 family)
MNKLAGENSPYLRHAAHQGVDWHPWSEEAFRRAEDEDKPVFLSSGAIWCHWCHVQAKECFENKEIAGLLNEKFICIKLDRDERPDIDRRYQEAAQTMGVGGGWPLSMFLTPGKRPFYGGTYFPPEDAHGRPGFKKVLNRVAEFYRSNRDEVNRYSESLIEHLRPQPAPVGEIAETSVREAVYGMLSDFDAQHGGFGAMPKFPMPGALEFIMNRYFFDPASIFEKCVRTTLTGMAKGGFYDHLGGGFHRYSVDEAWIVPHFEKMAEDNALLLRNYLDGYSLLGDEYFREVALGILGYVGSVLSAPEGGFYFSQDADITPADEGGYYTWTEEEFRKALDDNEYNVLSRHLLSDKGSMHHDPAKKVLFFAAEPGDIARELAMDIEEVKEIIRTGKEKLLKERDSRQTPFIDKTLYTSLNGLFVSAYIKAYRVLGDEGLLDFAMKSLERITEAHLKDDGLYHTEGVKGVLDDYVHLMEAFIDFYETTGDRAFLEKAELLMAKCLEGFWDESAAGFFDTSEEVAGLRLKAIEDIPHPSANALGVWLLLRLYYITQKKKYMEYAEGSLRFFSERASRLGLHSAYYYLALDAYYNPLSLRVEAWASGPLARAAASDFRPYRIIAYGGDAGQVVPCLRDRCLETVTDPEAMRELLRRNRFD